MKKTKMWLLALPLLFIALAGKAQSEQEQRIRASYLLAFGRDANSGEVTYWKGQGNRSVNDLYNIHKDYIKRDVGTRRQAIIRAYKDALGYSPSEGEINYHAQFNRTYTELMGDHINYITANRGEYNKVLTRSYQKVFGRSPSGDELAYWNRYAKCSYLLLVSYHETYKRANQSTATGGNLINFSQVSGVVAVPVSATVAKEARIAVSGLIGNDSAGIIAAGKGNLGAKLIGNDGSTLIGNDGSTLVGNDGASLVAAGGGN